MAGRFNVMAPDRDYIHAHRLVLPMARDGELIDMFLGMWVFDDSEN